MSLNRGGLASHSCSPAHEAGHSRILIGDHQGADPTIGALIIRIRFWGPLYYDYNKEPPKQHRKDLLLCKAIVSKGSLDRTWQNEGMTGYQD